MKKKGPKISYNRESQVLEIEVNKAKSIDSDIQGNVVIDYDKKGKIVRINLYNFRFDEFRNKIRAFKDFVRGSKASVLVK